MIQEEVSRYVDCMLDALYAKRAEDGKHRSFEEEGEIMWGLIRSMTKKEDSIYLRLIDYTGFLDPLCEEFTNPTIPKWAMDDIKVSAKAILVYAEENQHVLTPLVKNHLESIVAGKVPFGYTIEEEDCDI